MSYELQDVIGLNEANIAMDAALARQAPRCHFRPMGYTPADPESFTDAQWICTHCGHARPFLSSNQQKEVL